MYFGLPSREGFSEEEIQMGKGKFPFSYTSTSSPSSSSSHQPKTQLLGRLGNSPWDHHQIYDIHGHPMSCSNSWLGNRYEPEEEEEDNEEATVTAATAAIEADETKHVADEDSDSNPHEPRSASAVKIEKEHMFDKVVTPSDVGKLNRLVIPKQHAEKYFPLDSSANVKGLLLNFEDRNGKPWRFRYSYWNSSQSYVITKGWSRFVKDKKLDAGDVVSFQRVVGEGEAGKDRLFIDWKRRPNIVAAEAVIPFHRQYHLSNLHLSSVPWSPLLMPPPQSTGSGGVVYPRGAMGSVFYLRSAGPQMGMGMGMGMMEWEHQGGGGGGVVEPIVFDSVPVVQGKAAAKRLRLFGVNMECPISESEEASQSQPPQLISSSTTSSQLRLYNGTPLPPIDFLNANKGKASISFDLDM